MPSRYNIAAMQFSDIFQQSILWNLKWGQGSRDRTLSAVKHTLEYLFVSNIMPISTGVTYTTRIKGFEYGDLCS